MNSSYVTKSMSHEPSRADWICGDKEEKSVMSPILFDWITR